MENKFIVTEYGVEVNSNELQTEALQRVFNMCINDGGTVVIPKGRFYTGGLRMWSNTTLYLEEGAELIGSDICEDFEVFDVPENIELRTDMEMITDYYGKAWPEYRRSIISVYGGKNIKIIGEKDSLIDGNNCCDPNGEEGYRGPHGIFITNVDGIELTGYTIKDCGNFMHQIDNCKNIHIHDLRCEGGSDGVHLHCCVDTLVEDCIFHTGDDCVAGINMYNLTVRNCDINTSCDAFRMGGVHILVENCHIWGPGIYPHRLSVVQNRYTDLVRQKSNTLPREEGRHNTISVFVLFSSVHYPNPEPFHDIVFKDCVIEGVDTFLEYLANEHVLFTGTYLTGITLENVEFKNMKNPSLVKTVDEYPLNVDMINTTVTYQDSDKGNMLFSSDCKNVNVCVK